MSVYDFENRNDGMIINRGTITVDEGPCCDQQDAELTNTGSISNTGTLNVGDTDIKAGEF